MIRGTPPVAQVGLSADLGLTGMQVLRSRGEPELAVRTPLQLCFQLPDSGQVLHLRAEVVFDRAVEAAGRRLTGLRFSAMAPEVAAGLAGFLSSQSRRG